MSENSAADTGTTILLVDNKHVKELFGILEENGRDTTGLTALINHVSGMEDFVKRAEDRIADMKAQLDAMKELQDHPVKNKLQKAIKALETKVAEIKAQIAELKTNIIEGCKNAATAFKEKGVAALDKLAAFFHIKSGLQAIKNDTVKAVNTCDKAVADIEAFAKQYHTAGRAIKNLVRIIAGKEPIDAVKESGKLAKAVSAPYKAEKAIHLGIRTQVSKMITALDNLEHGAEVKRSEKAADNPKKPTLMERLDANKKKIAERERETPKKERVKAQGLEV
jgi:cob(I)alamin adenosyltransferase